jgi:hypothetical protein
LVQKEFFFACLVGKKNNFFGAAAKKLGKKIALPNANYRTANFLQTAVPSFGANKI